MAFVGLPSWGCVFHTADHIVGNTSPDQYLGVVECVWTAWDCHRGDRFPRVQVPSLKAENPGGGRFKSWRGLQPPHGHSLAAEALSSARKLQVRRGQRSGASRLRFSVTWRFYLTGRTGLGIVA